MKKIVMAVVALYIGILGANAQQESLSEMNWHRHNDTSCFGSKSDKALELLKSSGLKARPVVIALIDTGVDTTMQQISSAFLRYGDKMYHPLKKEYKGTRGSIAGWNFLGTTDGLFNLKTAGKESFRIMQQYHSKYNNIDQANLTSKEKEELAIYLTMRKKARIEAYVQFSQMLQTINQAVLYLDSIIVSQMGDRKIAFEDFQKINMDGVAEGDMPKVELVFSECVKARLKGMNTWDEYYNTSRNDYLLSVERLKSLGDSKSNPRYKLGDDLSNFEDNKYGNSNVMCDNYNSGSALMSILSAQKGANGISGIFPEAKVLTIRAIPEGDAFDKDIYRAIVYAVDCGAKVIVLGQSKEFSLNDSEVSKAFDYANQHDVMVVLNSGDEGRKIENNTIFPTALNASGERYPNVIRVGSIAPGGAKAPSSNYGSQAVDMFAPGEKVAAIYQKDMLAQMSGSSISATIVGGIANMIRSYFPKMKASEIKQLLIESVAAMPDTQMRTVSGTVELKAKDLSVSAGAVDALKAIEILLKKR